MECKIPKCYKSLKNKCSSPNPWVVFNKHHKFTSKTEKDNSYQQFKKSLQELKENNENAYRAFLCLYKKKEKKPLTTTTKSTIISNFVKRLMKERKEIELECKMTPNLISFFEKFVPSTIMGTSTLNPCRVIAKYMLGKCVPKDQLKYYTFQENMSAGAHGLILSGTFREKPVAIKIIPVHKRVPYQLSFMINGNPMTLRSVSEKNITREFNLQKEIGNFKFHTFQVPSIHGNVDIIKSKSNNDRIAVLVMDKVVDEIDMEKMSFEEQCKCVAQIPCILHKLHMKGFLHGDLHMWNLLITKKTSYVIDFGRSVNLKNTFIRNKQDLKMLQIMDYIIPLEMILRGVNSSTYKNVGKMMVDYLDGMDKCPAHKEINTLLTQINNELFKIDTQIVLNPITTDKITLDDLKERYNTITNLRLNYYYSNMTKNWADVLDI